jgi:large subunit ribosomal protein L6
MSRIGKSPIKLPSDVTVTVSDKGLVHVNGTRGVLSQLVDPAIAVKVEGDVVVLERKSNQRTHAALHGLYRSLLQNMVIGLQGQCTRWCVGAKPGLFSWHILCRS